MIALLAVILVGPTAQLWIALILIALHTSAMYRSLSPQADLALIILTILLLPPGLAPVVGSPLAVALMVPGLMLIDLRLRDLPILSDVTPFRFGRHPASVLNYLAVTALVAGLISLVVGSILIASAAVVLLLGLLVRLGHVLLSTRGLPITTESVRLRVLAGEKGRIRFCLRNETHVPLRGVLYALENWIGLSVQQFEIEASSTLEIGVEVNPSLSGPSRPAIQMMILDPWGLLWRGIEFHPIELRVIPRARYARQLARRYLEGTGVQRLSASTAPPREIGGAEFTRLREYQAGDRLKDVSWRYTAKFQEIIVKEHQGPQSGQVVILLNVVAGNIDEADWLVYQAVSSALTAATQDIPSALAAYDNEKSVLTTSLSDPRETLKQALRVSDHVLLAEPQQRVLDPPDLPRLSRSVRRLAVNAHTKTDGGIGRLLTLEINALEEMAYRHPLTEAIQRVLREIRPPATITVISQWNHDAEALAVTLPRLEKPGFRVLALQLNIKQSHISESLPSGYLRRL